MRITNHKTKARDIVNTVMKHRIVLSVFTTILVFTILMVSADETSDLAPKGIPQEKIASESLEVDSWPMFGYDLRHTGFSPSSAPDKPNLLWEFNPFPEEPESKQYMESSPAVVDGRVFIGSSAADDKRVYCLNETDGTLIWSYETNGWITSSPAVFEGKVFIGSEDGSVYSLNATTGALIWKYATDGRVHYSSPAVVDGRVFIGISWLYDSKGYLYSLNATTGAYIWNYTVPQNVYSSPAVVDGRVFIGATGPGRGRVYSLNETTGENIWTYTTGDHVGRSSPAVSDGMVFIGSFDHKVYALDMFTGSLIWSYTASSWIDSSPAVANGRVFIASEDGNIYSLNETTGAHIWTYKATGQIISHPAVANGVVFIGQGGPGLMALNETTGELVWSYVAGSTTQSSPAVVNGKVFVGFGEGVFSVGSPHSLTINPTFNDNIGSAFDPFPSSWSILFPNGTVRTVSSSSVTYPEVPTGNYSIVSIVWQGTEVVPEMPPTISVASDTLWTPAINCRLPIHLSIDLNASTSYIGFKVNINGRLVDYKNTSIAGAMVLMEYSVTGGEPWSAITADDTATDGSYSAVWMPSATGNYLVRATWAGNSTYPETTTIVNLAVLPFEEQNVFSVTSNSTISELAFNSTSRELSFTATGPSDTIGYVKVYIAKTLVDNIADLKVYLNGDQLNYTGTSLDDSWLLHFTYLHSTHKVTISLGQVSPPSDTTPPTIFIVSPQNKTYPVNDVSLTFTVNDSISWIGYSLDGQANVTITGNIILSELSDGSHSLIVYANDAAENTGASEIIYFSIDTQQVELPLLWIVAVPIIVAGVITAFLVFARVRKTTEKAK